MEPFGIVEPRPDGRFRTGQCRVRQHGRLFPAQGCGRMRAAIGKHRDGVGLLSFDQGKGGKGQKTRLAAPRRGREFGAAAKHSEDEAARSFEPA